MSSISSASSLEDATTCSTLFASTSMIPAASAASRRTLWAMSRSSRSMMS